MSEAHNRTIATINTIMHQLLEHPGCESEAHNSHNHHQQSVDEGSDEIVFMLAFDP